MARIDYQFFTDYKEFIDYITPLFGTTVSERIRIESGHKIKRVYNACSHAQLVDYLGTCVKSDSNEVAVSVHVYPKSWSICFFDYNFRTYRSFKIK